MAAKVKPVPEGFHTVTPYIVVDGAEKIIRFMKEAFGAEPVFEHKGVSINPQMPEPQPIGT